MTQLSSLFNTGKGSNYRYCDRGDPSSYDWDYTDLTIDSNWHDLDCSSIVPNDAVAILFNMRIKDDATNSWMQFRKNGQSNDVNVASFRTQCANVFIENEFIVSCDSDKIVEYRVLNTTWSDIEVAIKGWFIESGTSGGDVLSNANITDNALIRGDGGAKKIQECSTITVDDSGRMVNTGQPKFKAYVNTTQNNVTGDDTLYNATGSFWTENIDDGNNFSNGIFTAPVDGFYQFNVTMYIQGIVSSSNHKRFDLLLYTSNSTFSLNRLVITNALGGFAGGAGSVSVYLDANDTAYAQIIVANDTKVIGFSDNQSGFSGALIC